MATSSFCCSFEPRERVSGCAKAREREEKPRGNAGTHHCADIDGFQWRKIDAPASDFTETTASPVLDPERSGRGKDGVLKAEF
jgi:hypothetical protein